MSGSFDVVIVGGGAAGIGAARCLDAHGMAVLMLEAQPRLGGRAWTQEVGGHPLDLGCGWLHSGDRNPWVGVAEASGFPIECRELDWGEAVVVPGRTEAERAAARRAHDAWFGRLASFADTSDRASDALDPSDVWNPYVRAVAGFMSGVSPERISIRDYLAYDGASTGRNWRVPAGYGRLVATALPPTVTRRLATPAERVDLADGGVAVTTRAGTLRARAALLTVSTAVLAGDAIRLPSALDPWREAAAALPLGRNEKVFLEIQGAAQAALATEGHLFGSLQDASTVAFHIRPFGRAVIEAYLGGDGAEMLERDGPAAGYAHAVDQLAALFGNGMRAALRPLAASAWGKAPSVGGAYSCALPGHSDARDRLARPFQDRIFFAGEATHGVDFSTAHGAFGSGTRAADEILTILRTTAVA